MPGLLSHMIALNRLIGWLDGYATSVLSNRSLASGAGVSVWRYSEGSDSTSLEHYGPQILLPLAYAMSSNWRGRDGQGTFSSVAWSFGVACLKPIAELQIAHLDEEYEFLLAKYLTARGLDELYAREQVGKANCYLRMLAFVAASDVIGWLLAEKRQTYSSLSWDELALIRPVVDRSRAVRIDGHCNDYAAREITSEAESIIRSFETFMARSNS